MYDLLGGDKARPTEPPAAMLDVRRPTPTLFELAQRLPRSRGAWIWWRWAGARSWPAFKALLVCTCVRVSYLCAAGAALVDSPSSAYPSHSSAYARAISDTTRLGFALTWGLYLLTLTSLALAAAHRMEVWYTAAHAPKCEFTHVNGTRRLSCPQVGTVQFQMRVLDTRHPGSAVTFRRPCYMCAKHARRSKLMQWEPCRAAEPEPSSCFPAGADDCGGDEATSGAR